jgi:hypothetical protein
MQRGRDDEGVRIRLPISGRKKEQARLEPDDLAGGDGAVDENLPGRFQPVVEKIAGDGFVEESARRRKAEDPLRQGLHRVLRLHYS